MENEKSYDDGTLLIYVPSDEIPDLVENEDVVEIADEDSIKTIRNMQKEEINNRYRESNLEKEELEVTPDEIEDAGEKGSQALEDLGIEDTNNPYAYYFMNDDALPEADSIYEAYDIATSITYMTDPELWGEDEKWVTPNEVFVDTLNLSTNPLGIPMSDCEEHAIVFVDRAEAAGIPPENIRVITGYVEINDERFGHAWAQYYNGERWINIEPTSSDRYKDGELIEHDSFGVDYYEYRPYPVVDTWYAFNSKYFIDFDDGNDENTDIPDDWYNTTSSYNVDMDMSDGVSSTYEKIKIWLSVTIYTLLN